MDLAEIFPPKRARVTFVTCNAVVNLLVTIPTRLLPGGLIDYGHHANNAHHALTEALAMDSSVIKAMELTNKGRQGCQ